MKRLIRYFKNSLHTIGVIVGVLFIVFYISSHYNLTGLLTKKALTENLSEYLGTEVCLDSAKVDIFNQAVLENIVIKDQNSDTLLFARRAMVSFDLLPLILKKLQIHTIQLIDFGINLSKQDTLSDYNFQFLVDVIAPKDNNNNRKFLEDININSIILRSGSIQFDDKTKGYRKEYFDPNHFFLSNVSSNLSISASRSEGLYLKVKRLLFDEKSGLSISKASTVITTDAETKRLEINDINIECSQILFNRIKAKLKLAGFASMQEDVLDATISSLYVNSPNNIDIENSLTLKDILSTKEEMTFDFVLNKFKVSNHIASMAFDRYLNKDLNKIEPYLNDIEELAIEGKAFGSFSNFKYNALLASYGKLSSDIQFSGTYDKNKPLNIDIEGTLDNLTISKYDYRNLSLKGNLDTERFDGEIEIRDNKCDINSKIKYFYKKGNNRANIIAEVNRFEPYALNLTKFKNLEEVAFAGKIDADIHLKNLKKPLGQMIIDSLVLSKEEETYTIPEIKVKSEQNDNLFHANILSPIVSGFYSQTDSLTSLNGKLFASKELSDFLQLPYSINKDAQINLQIDSLREITNAVIVAPEIQYQKNIFDINLHSRNEDKRLTHELKLDYKIGKNNISTSLEATTTNNPLSIHIKPCEITLNKDIISCGGLSVSQQEDKSINISQFNLALNEQKVNALGIISENGDLDINVDVEKLQIDTLFTFLNKEFVKFGGIATGKIEVKKDSTIHFGSNNLFVKNFSYLNGLLGDTNIKANYDLTKQELLVDADILCEDNHNTKIEGYVNCSRNDSLDLYFDANKLKLDFLNTWVGGFLEEFKGEVTGLLHLYGPGEELKLIGEPYAEASFTNHMSGSKLYLKDYISLFKDRDSDNSHINLNNASLTDSYGNKASLTAEINHCHFNHFKYNINIDLPTQTGFLLFDKPSHYNNELYWGQIFGTGKVAFKGSGNKHQIDINCQTVGKSQLNISPGEENYLDKGYSFLTFRDKKIFEESERHDYSKDFFDFSSSRNTSTNRQSVDFNLQAQITENCQVYVQMDPLAEDRLICRGNGDLSLHYNPNNEFTLTGEYNMTSGGYLVTMKGDLLNKEFKIQNGSRIVFPGNFNNAELDLNAIYSIPSVNLKDLDNSFSSLASLNRTTFPVDCKLAVNGLISAPQVSFDLEVKNTSDDVQALVHNIIGTPEMLNREVFYLLLFSKFYTPEYASTSQNNSGSEISSFASSSLTSQLNNLLGQISDYFTMGTNFRSDKGDFSDLEMDVSLSTSLFNDRLILNGNLGYRDPANRVGLRNNSNSFIGDFDIEYLINRKGTLRAKAYSHYNERDYSINNALTTQGIGFIVRKDYKSFKDLFNWKSDKKKK